MAMVMQFRTAKLRDDLARRLGVLAVEMTRASDPAHKIDVTPKLIDDIRTAAYLVGMTEVMDGPDSSSTRQEPKDGR